MGSSVGVRVRGRELRLWVLGERTLDGVAVLVALAREALGGGALERLVRVRVRVRVRPWRRSP